MTTVNNLRNIPACLRVIARQIEEGKIAADVGVLTLRACASEAPTVFGFGEIVEPFDELNRAAAEVERLTAAGAGSDGVL